MVMLLGIPPVLGLVVEIAASIPITMPLPLTDFVDASTTLADAFTATGNLFGQVDTFVAWGIGVALVGVVISLVRKAVRR